MSLLEMQLTLKCSEMLFRIEKPAQKEPMNSLRMDIKIWIGQTVSQYHMTFILKIHPWLGLETSIRT